MREFGVYVHIPFCLSKCPYCDFCSFPGKSDEDRDAYVNALLCEIGGREYPTREVTSLYFGGGTPSLLSEGQMAAILDALTKRFPISRDAEITFEMNPATADRTKLVAFRSLGFNRVSIGCQSFDDRELSALGRVHTAEQAKKAFSDARDAGFSNINLDLIYAIPHQTEETLGASLRSALALSPEHLSAYGLIVEDGTPFSRQRDSLCLPGDDAEADYYALISDTLRSAGYRHYEISNYARPGCECRHNLLYWHRGEYAAFGLSASSHIAGVRETNTRDLARYLSDPIRAVSERAVIKGKEAAYEYIMLALRLSEGVSESDFCRRFGYSFRDAYRDKLAPYLAAGYLVFDGDRTALSDRGLYLSSALLTDLLPD